MGKNKLEQFAELKTFHNVIEAPKSEWLQRHHEIRGNWGQRMFGNNHPIVLELGCGKGEYTVGMARKFGHKNFIGVDIKGNRMWRGAKTTVDEKIPNAAFLRTRIDFITAFFTADEVSEIWLTFSDPQPGESRGRKRLTSPLFIDRYRQLLKPGGIIHVKTDSELLYQYTLEQIQEKGYKLLFETSNLYGTAITEFDEDTREILEIKTHYEQIFLARGQNIHYIKFTLD